MDGVIEELRPTLGVARQTIRRRHRPNAKPESS
jgi:hypothetical protein